jgi:hypothetical protein
MVDSVVRQSFLVLARVWARGTAVEKGSSTEIVQFMLTGAECRSIVSATDDLGVAQRRTLPVGGR